MMPSFEMVRSRASHGIDVAYFGRHPSQDHEVRSARAMWFVMGMWLALMVVPSMVAGNSQYRTFYFGWPGCLVGLALALIWTGGMLLTRWYCGLKGAPWNRVVEVTVVADPARDLDGLLTEILALDGSDVNRVAALTERARALKASRRAARSEETRWRLHPMVIPVAVGLPVLLAYAMVPVFAIALS
jgi:hypothetical protein